MRGDTKEGEDVWAVRWVVWEGGGGGNRRRHGPRPTARGPTTKTHLDVVGDDGHVLEVEGRVDLVHDVEGRGLVVVEREDERERRERLLSARQVRDVLPALLGGPDAEDDALREGVEAINKLKLGIAAESDHLVHLLEAEGDDTAFGAEGNGEVCGCDSEGGGCEDRVTRPSRIAQCHCDSPEALHEGVEPLLAQALVRLACLLPTLGNCLELCNALEVLPLLCPAKGREGRAGGRKEGKGGVSDLNAQCRSSSLALSPLSLLGSGHSSFLFPSSSHSHSLTCTPGLPRGWPCCEGP
jgi:hypothetical protein